MSTIPSHQYDRIPLESAMRMSVAWDLTPAPAREVANFGTITQSTKPSIAMPATAMNAG